MKPATGSGGESLSVHQLLQRLASEYRSRFADAMPRRHARILARILSCRTSALGGQMFACDDCGELHYRYHSCGDRHCPLCGQTDADEWLEDRKARLLLPTHYFLATFTVPEALRPFIRSHQEIGLNLLFACSSQALQDLAANPRHLGASLGMLGVCHTWSRTLIYHPHIHYLIPGGGLTPDGRQWIGADPKFLLPVKALGAHFRTLYKNRLQEEHPDLFAQVPAKAWKRSWIVDCRPAGSGENALRYLSRYIFKTATGNRDVTLLPDGRMRWDYRESSTGKPASLKLDPLDWMGRFMQHILPRGFTRVRTFGWLHPAAKVRANRVRALLGEAPLLSPAEEAAWLPSDDPEIDPDFEPSDDPLPAPASHAPLCPRCGKVMRLVASWKPGHVWMLAPRPP